MKIKIFTLLFAAAVLFSPAASGFAEIFAPQFFILEASAMEGVSKDALYNGSFDLSGGFTENIAENRPSADIGDIYAVLPENAKNLTAKKTGFSFLPENVQYSILTAGFDVLDKMRMQNASVPRDNRAFFALFFILSYICMIKAVSAFNKNVMPGILKTSVFD
jgi:hypothetical protein